MTPSDWQIGFIEFVVAPLALSLAAFSDTPSLRSIEGFRV